MSRTRGMPEGGLSRKERRQLKAHQRETEERRARRRRLATKWVTWGVVGLVIAVGGGWLGYSIATVKRLPPTGIAGHVEQNPPGHILTTPMPLAIQKHMLEHADGGGRPGVVINYNCVKFRCPEGMVDLLAGMVRAFPDFVYLAPYPEMDVRIAVTRLGKILTLDEPDLEKIRAFITE